MTTHSLRHSAKQPVALTVRADGFYTLLVGIGMIIFFNTIGRWLGIEQTGLIAIDGVVLTLYAIGLIWLTRSGQAPVWLGVTIAVLNVLWIDGTVLLLVTDWLPLEPAGRWLLTIIAVGAGIAGAAQFYASWYQHRTR